MVNDSVWKADNIAIILQVPNWLISSAKYDVRGKKSNVFMTRVHSTSFKSYAVLENRMK